MTNKKVFSNSNRKGGYSTFWIALLHSCIEEEPQKEDNNTSFIDTCKELGKQRHRITTRQKIVETYRDHEKIEKFSHFTTLQKIADNNYNLNVLRYIETFEKEEPIDIKAVMVESRNREPT